MTASGTDSAMQRAAYRFRPMSPRDLPMVKRWLATPHVREWWGDADEQFALVSGDLSEAAMDQFIVSSNGQPFGYIQSYDLGAWPDETFGVHPIGTRAIDQFIGEPGMIDRGHGSAFIAAFADGLSAAGTPRVLTNPDAANGRAIRAYEKAGFRKIRLVNTLDGRALLMIRDNLDLATAT